MTTVISLSTAAILVAISAFFVAVEFSLVAARRYRLEDAAEQSISARAALRSSKDLSLLLAGSQLGITLCTLGLGAVAKPAVHDLLVPVLTARGLPQTSADAIGFILALMVVTFIHLVVGEMAPKSWAIAHPERSATLLALPMRAFMWLTRPILIALNGAANWCVQRLGVEPVNELSAGRTPETFRALVAHSAQAGVLETDRQEQLLRTMELHTAPLRTLVRTEEITGVQKTDTLAAVAEVAHQHGHLRLVVWDGNRPLGMVHVRDTLDVDPDTTVATIMRPILVLPADKPIYHALTIMRQKYNQFALVYEGNQLLGLVTMQDVLNRLLPASQPPPEPAAV